MTTQVIEGVRLATTLAAGASLTYNVFEKKEHIYNTVLSAVDYVEEQLGTTYFVEYEKYDLNKVEIDKTNKKLGELKVHGREKTKLEISKERRDKKERNLAKRRKQKKKRRRRKR